MNPVSGPPALGPPRYQSRSGLLVTPRTRTQHRLARASGSERRAGKATTFRGPDRSIVEKIDSSRIPDAGQDHELPPFTLFRVGLG
jgi:hypothetical protein